MEAQHFSPSTCIHQRLLDTKGLDVTDRQVDDESCPYLCALNFEFHVILACRFAIFALLPAVAVASVAHFFPRVEQHGTAFGPVTVSRVIGTCSTPAPAPGSQIEKSSETSDIDATVNTFSKQRHETPARQLNGRAPNN